MAALKSKDKEQCKFWNRYINYLFGTKGSYFPFAQNEITHSIYVPNPNIQILKRVPFLTKLYSSISSLLKF